MYRIEVNFGVLIAESHPQHLHHARAEQIHQGSSHSIPSYHEMVKV